MKNYIFIRKLLFFLILFWIKIGSSEETPRRLSELYQQLSPVIKTNELAKTGDIQTSLIKAQKMFRLMDECLNNSIEANFDSLYMVGTNILVDIIQKHPTNTASLTARLMLAINCHSLDSLDTKSAINIYREIYEQFPTTWQGKLALLGIAYELDQLCKSKETINQIRKYLQEIKSLDEIKNDDLDWFKKEVLEIGNEDKIDILIWEILEIAYCKIGDFKNARKVCEYLIQNYSAFSKKQHIELDLEMIRMNKSPYSCN